MKLTTFGSTYVFVGGFVAVSLEGYEKSPVTAKVLKKNLDKVKVENHSKLERFLEQKMGAMAE